MTGDELLEGMVADYLAAELPPDPTERVAVLHEIVARRWVGLPLQDRLLVAADLDGTDGLVKDETEMTLEDVSALDDLAVDSLTSLARARIPELAVPEV